MYAKPCFCIPILAAVIALTGCASVLDHDGASTVAPYYIEKEGRIVIDVQINDEGPFKFTLDTAASISAVFDNLRHELALQTFPNQTVIIHGAVSSEQFSLLDIRQLEIGNELWPNPKLVSLPGATGCARLVDR